MKSKEEIAKSTYGQAYESLCEKRQKVVDDLFMIQENDKERL